jgi:hypothetical protein
MSFNSNGFVRNALGNHENEHRLKATSPLSSYLLASFFSGCFFCESSVHGGTMPATRA